MTTRQPGDEEEQPGILDNLSPSGLARFFTGGGTETNPVSQPQTDRVNIPSDPELAAYNQQIGAGIGMIEDIPGFGPPLANTFTNVERDPQLRAQYANARNEARQDSSRLQEIEIAKGLARAETIDQQTADIRAHQNREAWQELADSARVDEDVVNFYRVLYADSANIPGVFTETGQERILQATESDSARGTEISPQEFQDIQRGTIREGTQGALALSNFIAVPVIGARGAVTGYRVFRNADDATAS